MSRLLETGVLTSAVVCLALDRPGFGGQVGLQQMTSLEESRGPMGDLSRGGDAIRLQRRGTARGG